jgi:hypothetical protein
MLLLYSFVFKIIDHHLKLNISMYYLTILIRVHSTLVRLRTISDIRKIRIRNHIRAISAPLCFRQKI